MSHKFSHKSARRDETRFAPQGGLVKLRDLFCPRTRSKTRGSASQPRPMGPHLDAEASAHTISALSCPLCEVEVFVRSVANPWADGHLRFVWRARAGFA